MPTKVNKSIHQIPKPTAHIRKVAWIQLVPWHTLFEKKGVKAHNHPLGDPKLELTLPYDLGGLTICSWSFLPSILLLVTILRHLLSNIKWPLRIQHQYHGERMWISDCQPRLPHPAAPAPAYWRCHHLPKWQNESNWGVPNRWSATTVESELQFSPQVVNTLETWTCYTATLWSYILQHFWTSQGISILC